MKDKIEDIKDEISGCTKCDLSENRTNIVPGEGFENADIVIVGEAPGKNEDESGRPFVGRAGDVLTECLDKAGLERDEVFITNTVKCRPPENRDPRKKELETCRPYLEKQLEAVDPCLIIPLGNSALDSLLGMKKISEKRGEFFEEDGWRYMPTYHPAATIYNRKLRPQLVKDLKKAIKTVEEIKK